MTARTMRAVMAPTSTMIPQLLSGRDIDRERRSTPERAANCETLLGGGGFGAGAETLLDVVGDHHLELVSDVGAAERCDLLTLDEHRGGGGFAGAGERDADVGVLALARAVDDAAHHCHRQRFDARVALAPLGH